MILGGYVKLAAGVGVLALLTWGYFEIKASGYEACEAENKVAIDTRDQRISELVAQHAQALQDFQSQINQTRSQADARIRKLLSENETLRAWWETSVPADAADYAWGLRDAAGAGAVPSGSNAAQTDRR